MDMFGGTEYIAPDSRQRKPGHRKNTEVIQIGAQRGLVEGRIF